MSSRPDIVVPDDVSGEGRHYTWWSETAPVPQRIRVADDRTRADEAVRRARAGEALAWVGDWQNARQLLAAMGRRLVPPRARQPGAAARFKAEREGRRVENAVLSRLVVPIGPGWESPLARAPRLEAPLSAAFGAAPDRAALMPLRELLGAIGAYEWFRRGVPVAALRGNVHPRYGVFAPIRSEYVDLFAEAVAARGAALGLAHGARAFDVGTGTGVLAILLAKAGARVVATDIDPRAVVCARENAARFGVSNRIEVVEADLFPPGCARLVVANPPWVPEVPHGPLDRAIYDPGGMVLARLVGGMREHLERGGEGWLILSDLAERLGLRPWGAVETMISAAGLRIAATLTAKPTHPRARASLRAPETDGHPDPVAAARASETTRLYAMNAAAAAP